MDEEEKQVVENARRQGGFEYARLMERAALGNGFAAEAAHEIAWEQLHCGPWHAVHDAWRDAYALSCLRLALHRLHDAMRLLDMGLLMGGPLLKPRLHSAIAQLQSQLQQPSRASHENSSEDLAQVSHGSQHAGASAHVLDACMVGASIADDDYSEWSIRSSPEDTACMVGASIADDNYSEWSICASPEDTACQLLAAKRFNNLPQVAESMLPQGSLCHQTVTRKKLLSMEDFICDHFIPNVPVIITNAMTHWPAMDKWKSLDYFKNALGSRTIPVEVGKHYLASEWKQELMTIDQLLQRFQSADCSSGRPYLAQHPLFEQIPMLKGDIVAPDYCAATGGELRAINAWFGPCGTVTPLHHDPHHNLLSQVLGQKYVRLYSPLQDYGLYPFKESMLCNSSQVDLDNPDYEKFPHSENLPFLDCILEEGEMLYIPPKWWHYVRSLSLSFSVSFWWNNSED